MPAIGIDFGTENCYIAVVRHGVVDTLLNEYSQRNTPTYIGFGKNNRDIGVSAMCRHLSNSGSTVYNFKKLMGKKYDHIGQEQCSLHYQMVQLPNRNIGIKVKYLQDDTIFTAEQLTAMMFTKLKQIAEEALKINVKECVISVPLFFTDAERQGILDAATIANLLVLQLINDTTAAALLYGYYNDTLPKANEGSNVAFVDMGASSMQVSICRMNRKKLKVISIAWESDIGGRSFDEVIFQHFLREFSKVHKVDLQTNKRAVIKLRKECEKLKKLLTSNSQQMPFHVECLFEDIDFNGVYQRSIFEEECKQLLAKIRDTLERSLTKAGLSADDVNSVHLIGGSTRVPIIKQIVKEVFKKEPSTTLNQEEAIAQGCAIQCALLMPEMKMRKYSITEILPYTIHLILSSKFSEREKCEGFKQNIEIPCQKTITLMKNESFLLQAFTDKYIKLGEYIIQNVIPFEGRDVKISLVIQLDKNGMFQIVSASHVEDSLLKEEQMQLVRMNSADSFAPEISSFVWKDKSDIKMKSDSVTTNEKLSWLEVEPMLFTLSSEELKRYVEMEKTMINRDEQERYRHEAKNAFEELIYEIRNNLSDEMEPSQQDYARQILDNAENWLLTEGEDQPEGVYKEKLQELKDCFTK